MKTTILTLKLSLLVIFFSASSFSQNFLKDRLSLNKESSQNILMIEDKIEKKSNLNVPLSHTNLLSDFKQNKPDFSSVYENTQKKKKKSVGLGVVLSALLPGAGEFYGENYLKAGIFFGIELLAWGTYLYFERKGDKKTDEYYAYADQYWSINEYARFLKNNNFRENSQINPDEQNRAILEEQIRICERANFSHTLPEYKSQQYYELIGKYQNFQGGWTNLVNRPNTDPGSAYYYETYRDPIFTAYAVEREKANDFYEYAKIGPVTAIINHILSAADAAWVISTYNSKIKVETGFRMNNKVSPYTYRFVQIPTFNLNVNF
jgi:hypothetical protein